MMMYSIRKGRRGTLVKPDGSVAPFEATREIAAFSDHIVCDPIRLHNAHGDMGYLALNLNDAFDKRAYDLAHEGFTVFEMPGKQSGKRYAFAIVLTEDDSEMD